MLDLDSGWMNYFASLVNPCQGHRFRSPISNVVKPLDEGKHHVQEVVTTHPGGLENILEYNIRTSEVRKCYYLNECFDLNPQSD